MSLWRVPRDYTYWRTHAKTRAQKRLGVANFEGLFPLIFAAPKLSYSLRCSTHEAADLIRHFRTYWDQCVDVDEPDEARQQLLAKIVDRVFVYDDHVVAIALHGDFNIVLDDEDAMPVEIAEVLGEKIEARHSEMTRGRCGSDGHRPLVGCVIVTGRFRRSLRNLPQRMAA